MITHFKNLTAGVVLLLTLCGVSLSQTPAPQTSLSKAQVPRVIKYNGDVAMLLAHLPEVYGVTIGFEIDAQQPQPQAEFYLDNPTLPDVLNAIVKSAPKYQWCENDGFAAVFPLAGSIPLLDTMITSGRITDDNWAGAIDQLMNLPEIQANIRAMSLNRRPLNTATKKGEKFSVTLTGVSLRMALQKIAKESGAQFWIFRNYSDGTFSITTLTN